MDETPDVMADGNNEANDVANNPDANEVEDTTPALTAVQYFERRAAESATQRSTTLREAMQETGARAQNDKPEEVTDQTGSGSAYNRCHDDRKNNIQVTMKSSYQRHQF